MFCSTNNGKIDITHDQEQESGRTTIRSNPSDACFQHFLFICLHRRIPLGVTSDNLNWLAREQGFASYPSGSASGSDLFYIRLYRTTRPRSVRSDPARDVGCSRRDRTDPTETPMSNSVLPRARSAGYQFHSRSGHSLR